MGLYDRDYYRAAPAPTGLGAVRLWSVTVWLLIANVAVFALDGLLLRRHGVPPMGEDLPDLASRIAHYIGPLSRWGHFSMETAVYHLQLWRVITFQFLHAGLGHLLANMVALVLFGPIVEAHFGRARFLAFYLLCGIAGAVSYVLLFAAGLFVHDPVVPLVGASAGIFGVLIAAAVICPDLEVPIWIMWGTIPLRVLAIVMMLVAVVAVFTGGPNAGGEAGHLGGGLLGLVFMLNQHWLNPFATPRRMAGAHRRKKRLFQKDWSKDLNR